MNLFWTVYYKLLAKSDAKVPTEASKHIDKVVTETLGPVVK